LSSEVQMLESRYNKLMSENANLAEEMRRKDEFFSMPSIKLILMKEYVIWKPSNPFGNQGTMSF